MKTELKDVKLSSTDMAQFPADLHPAMREASGVWADIYNVVMYADNALFSGPPGTGKSRVSRIHGLNGRHLETTSLTYETCWPEVRGCYMLDKDGMRYIDGPGVRAWRQGSRWCIDEIDQAGGDTIPGLHTLLDDRAVARLTLPTGETVTPSETFQCFATTNADPKALPEALMDRFAIKREVLFPDPRFLMSLPMALRPAAAYALFSPNSAAKEIAKLTTRQWVVIGGKMDKFGLSTRDAVELVTGPKRSLAASNAIEAARAKVAAQGAEAV